MKILLITPPMTQLNSPYPATAYLKAHLQTQGHEVYHADLGLELALELFSRQGLQKIRNELERRPQREDSDSVAFFKEAYDDYHTTIDPVIRFLQGLDPSMAVRISRRSLLPEGPRFVPLQEHGENLLASFGEMAVQDLAKYRASLYLDDIADVIREGIDPRFEFSRYGESLASSQASFTPLLTNLRQPHTLVDEILLALVDKHLTAIEGGVDIVGFSVPFPGNVYAALRIGQHLQEHYPQAVRVMGGGFVNTELRELTDSRIFDFVDYLIFDDGEAPLDLLLEHLQGRAKRESLGRVKYRGARNEVVSQMQISKTIAFKDTGAPDYTGLPLERYIPMTELPNPMFRLWSDFRWNKMVLAHGCYWKKCTFCDVNLDYIGRYEPHKAVRFVDYMEQVQRQTGSSGFHFVDEAAPPALLKAVSEEILRRGLKFSWWGNLRFDEFFTAEVARIMADAGCIAVTGGLEVASSRVLKLINKGITVEQVTRVTKNFQAAGIFVHAYLMYGFPTQTREETIESLENVRRLFNAGSLNSGHWHRFLCTVHSPVGREPDKFNIRLRPVPIPKEGLFARYEIPFISHHEDSTLTELDELGQGLRKALFNYMHGVGLEHPAEYWFSVK